MGQGGGIQWSEGADLRRWRHRGKLAGDPNAPAAQRRVAGKVVLGDDIERPARGEQAVGGQDGQRVGVRQGIPDLPDDLADRVVLRAGLGAGVGGETEEVVDAVGAEVAHEFLGERDSGPAETRRKPIGSSGPANQAGTRLNAGEFRRVRVRLRSAAVSGPSAAKSGPRQRPAIRPSRRRPRRRARG